MVYPIHIHGIYHTYTRFSNLQVLPAYKEAIMMYLGRNGDACTQHDISGQQCDSFQNSFFTTRQDIPCIYRYIYGIYRYIRGIYHAKFTCKPSWLPIRVWKPQVGTSFGSSQFWTQIGHPREAGVVQSSTTRC